MKRLAVWATMASSVLVGCSSKTEYLDEGRVCFVSSNGSTQAVVVLEEKQKACRKGESSSCTARFDGRDTITITSQASYEESDGDCILPGPYSVRCAVEGTLPAGPINVVHGATRTTQTFPAPASGCP